MVSRPSISARLYCTKWPFHFALNSLSQTLDVCNWRTVDGWQAELGLLPLPVIPWSKELVLKHAKSQVSDVSMLMLLCSSLHCWKVSQLIMLTLISSSEIQSFLFDHVNVVVYSHFAVTLCTLWAFSKDLNDVLNGCLIFPSTRPRWTSELMFLSRHLISDECAHGHIWLEFIQNLDLPRRSNRYAELDGYFVPRWWGQRARFHNRQFAVWHLLFKSFHSTKCQSESLIHFLFTKTEFVTDGSIVNLSFQPPPSLLPYSIKRGVGGGWVDGWVSRRYIHRGLNTGRVR